MSRWLVSRFGRGPGVIRLFGMSEGTVDTSEDRESQRKRRTVLLRERAARRRQFKSEGWSKRDFEEYFEDDEEWVKKQLKIEEEIHRRGQLATWRLLGVSLADQDTYENDSLEQQVDKQNDRIEAAVRVCCRNR